MLVMLFQQTQSLLSDFMKDHQQQQQKHSNKRQPFYNFVSSEADKFSDAQYDSKQMYWTFFLTR